MQQFYLVTYNSFQLLGWTVALYRILTTVLTTASTTGAFAVSGDLISILQAVSFLEVIHAATGLVPSGVLNSMMQWMGRTHFILAILRQISEIQELPQVIRYSHYVFTGIGSCPPWLTYLRYTAFILLYPIGLFIGEMWIMYEALPYIKERNMYSNFFSKFSISYYSFVVAVLACYPFLWLRLYLHLFRQRRSKLQKHRQKKQV